MSKTVKKVASIALPIVGSIVGGPIGGAIGGAIGGYVGGGKLPGAILGAVGGYAGAGAINDIVGHTAGTTLGGVLGNAAQGPTMGSGILGAATGGGVRALGAGITQAASSAISPTSGLTGIANQLMTEENADAAEKAARIQAGAIDRATATQQPYNALGTEAAGRIQTIQNDKAGYIKNNPLYNSLASDAERRLLTNQAAKGKVGSGGTAVALQDELLQIGNGLVNQEINTLQNQVNTGQRSSGVSADLAVGRGDVQASGVMGRNNAYQTGYQNQISTLLALQNLGRVPTYAPTPQVNV